MSDIINALRFTIVDGKYKITYGRATYVSEVGCDMLDLISINLNTVATGDGIAIVDIEELLDFVARVDADTTEEEYDSSDRVLANFLNQVETSMDGDVGDIFFCK